jgi:DNA repair exonuclease SbcCD ATPase subunit
VSSADKCPVCSKTLEAAEHENAVKQLEKGVFQKYRDKLRKAKQEHIGTLVKFKQEQHKRMQTMAKRQQSEKKSLQKRLVEQARRNKESGRRELAQLKKNYQAQLEQMREFYATQNAALQNELKTSYAAQLEGMKKNYEGLSASNQRQLETLQKYLEDELVGELKEKVSQLEQDKLSTELRLTELVQDLDERNTEVVSLKERLRRFDDGVPEEQKEADQVQSEVPEPGNDQQQELLKIVKEIAQQRELGDLRELEEDEPEEEEKHGLWTSRPGKRFGLF